MLLAEGHQCRNVSAVEGCNVFAWLVRERGTKHHLRCSSTACELHGDVKCVLVQHVARCDVYVGSSTNKSRLETGRTMQEAADGNKFVV